MGGERAVGFVDDAVDVGTDAAVGDPVQTELVLEGREPGPLTPGLDELRRHGRMPILELLRH